MDSFYIPKDYKSPQSIKETQKAIEEVKNYFEQALSESLNLTRVTAPIFVSSDTGLNDNLNGVEQPVTFNAKEQESKDLEIVHSLAKWKRIALKMYNFEK